MVSNLNEAHIIATAKVQAKANQNINLNPCERRGNNVFINGKKIECELYSKNLTNEQGQGYVINIDNANVVYVELPSYYKELQGVLDSFVEFMGEVVKTSSASTGLGMASTYPITPSTALVKKSNEAINLINQLKAKLP